MWKLLTRVVNAAEMRTIIAWFVASAVLQGLTLALMIPFLRALYSRSQFLTAWLIAVVVMAVSAALVETIAMHRSYRVSVFEVCDTMIDRVADHVLTLPLGWFSAEREAAVVNATSKEVNTLSHLASMVIPTCATPSSSHWSCSAPPPSSSAPGAHHDRPPSSRWS